MLWDVPIQILESQVLISNCIDGPNLWEKYIQSSREYEELPSFIKKFYMNCYQVFKKKFYMNYSKNEIHKGLIETLSVVSERNRYILAVVIHNIKDFG